MFDRFFKGKSADTCDAILANGPNAETVIYSIHRDGVIRCWSYKVNKMKCFWLLIINICSILDKISDFYYECC